MYSGGVESTALVEWVLTQGVYEPILIHSVFPHPKSAAKRLNKNVKTYAAERGLELIVDKHPNWSKTYPFHDDRFDAQSHWYLSMLRARVYWKDITEFYYGANAGIKTYGTGGDYPQVKVTEPQFTILWEYFGKMFDKDYGQWFYAPLDGLTKREQYNIIPPEYRKHCISCAKPPKYNGKSQCGECPKCYRFIELTAPE